VQAVADVQDTARPPFAVAPSGSGSLSVVQLVPFHCAATALDAAMHILSETHESWLVPANVATGLVPCLQLLPFHCSLSSLEPNDMQNVEDEHDTLFSVSAPSGAVTVVLLQLVPSHLDAAGTNLKSSLTAVPTDMQNVSDVQETPAGASPRFVWLLHSVPFQRSMWLSLVAVQPLSDEQETARSGHPLGDGSVISVHLLPSHDCAIAVASPVASTLE